MIEWLNEQIFHIARRLEHGMFLSKTTRASLQDELSKLLKMREAHDEQKKKEREENDSLKRW